jgi:hypothetical protein
MERSTAAVGTCSPANLGMIIAVAVGLTSGAIRTPMELAARPQAYHLGLYSRWLPTRYHGLRSIPSQVNFMDRQASP